MLSGDSADQLSMHGSRERPLLLDVLERLVVDLDDHEVLGRRIIASDREPEVDARSLERFQRVGGERNDRDPARSDRDQRQQQAAKPPTASDPEPRPLGSHEMLRKEVGPSTSRLGGGAPRSK